jgi:putative Mn2+ efflux pump MntP
MIAVIILGFVVGLDNLRIGLSIGALNLPRTRQTHLALAFGFFEALMPLLGLAIGHSTLPIVGRWAVYLGPIVLASCGVYIMYLSFKEDKSDELFASRWMLWGLPLSLSFDNLLAGVGLGLLGFQVLLSALVIGVMSSFLSYLGLRLGNMLVKYLPPRAELISGITMIALAFLIIVFDS